MSDYERIEVFALAGVQTLTLSRPERGNALDRTMIRELLRALEEAYATAEVRAIVLTGAGKAFCAGGDIAQMGDSSETPWTEAYANLLVVLARADKPIIARVNGVALGGGLGLVAASTFAVASTNAKLGTPEIDVGLFPMMITAILARVMPRRRLLEMMLLGQTVSADEAVRLGLVNRAVAPENLDTEVTAITDAIAGKSPTALRLGLRAFAAQENLELERALPMLGERLAQCLATADAREGITAFREKRAPRWTGK